MTLMDKISEDMKKAMKSGEKLRLETLRMIRAQLLEKRVERRPSGDITLEDEITVLTAASKKRKEAIEVYQQHGKTEMAIQEQQELAIIQEYLPKQLTVQEVEALIQKKIEELQATSAKDFGKVMSVVMKELRGKADGKLIQEIVKKILGT
ncbi:MAG: GatB/YqeY domain-containing protein [Bacteroidota bacterium]|jgi:uncharacterized protein YqeY